MILRYGKFNEYIIIIIIQWDGVGWCVYISLLLIFLGLFVEIKNLSCVSESCIIQISCRQSNPGGVFAFHGTHELVDVQDR